jgi:vacuolar-type H+-ATPase subunit E/Vma4
MERKIGNFIERDYKFSGKKTSSVVASNSYNLSMARGWESKSVEAQMETAQQNQIAEGKAALSDDEKNRKRERDGLRLSRAYLLHKIESSTNERYTETLRKALAEIEQKLAQLK